jgi:hypothetical protein
MGFITLPCPVTAITILDNWIKIDFLALLLLFGACFLVLGCVEDIVSLHLWPRIVWGLLGVGITCLYWVTIFVNLSNTNVITWSWVVLNGIGFLCTTGIWWDHATHHIIYSANYADETEPGGTHSVKALSGAMTLEGEKREKSKSRTRFVLPIQTTHLYPEKATNKTSKKD